MISIHEVWSESLNVIKDRVTGRTIWETLDAVQPITVEDGVVVLGLPHTLASNAGHLLSSTTRNSIEQVLTARLGKRVTIQVIEGVSPQDWDLVKRRAAAARQLEDQQHQKTLRHVSASAVWDELHDQVARKYASYPNRSLAHVRGQYVFDCVEMVIEALNEVGDPEETSERNYARVLERIGQNAEVPAAVVAALVIMKRTGMGAVVSG